MHIANMARKNAIALKTTILCAVALGEKLDLDDALILAVRQPAGRGLAKVANQNHAVAELLQAICVALGCIEPEPAIDKPSSEPVGDEAAQEGDSSTEEEIAPPEGTQEAEQAVTLEATTKKRAKK